MFLLVSQKNMILLPPEVWLIVFSFSSYNDLIEASAVWKLFYELSRKNSGYVEKLLHLRQHLINSRIVFTGYGTSVCHFVASLFIIWSSMLGKKIFFLMPKILSWVDSFIVYCLLVFGIRCFTVWEVNIVWTCVCTKIYVSDKKISDHVNKHMYVSLNQFHPSIREGIVSANKIFFCS